MLVSRRLFKISLQNRTLGPHSTGSVSRHLFIKKYDNARGKNNNKSNGNATQSIISLRTGQSVKAKVIQIGPLGAGVTIDGDDSRRGLVLRKEVDLFRQYRGKHIILGEELPAYIEKDFGDGRIYVQLRPILLDRIEGVAEQILEALECSTAVPPSIPVGDKSKPDAIQAFFYGVTKADFKAAVGLLYRLGYVVPGETETKMHSAMSTHPNAGGESAESSTDVVGSLVHQMKANRSPPAALFSPLSHFREQSALASSHVRAEQPFLQRFIEANLDRPCTVFLANLSFGTTRQSLRNDLLAILGYTTDIFDLRVHSDKSVRNLPCGWLRLNSEEHANSAAKVLQESVLNGRKLVVAYYPRDSVNKLEKKQHSEEIEKNRIERLKTLMQQIDTRSSIVDLEAMPYLQDSGASRSVQSRPREVKETKNYHDDWRLAKTSDFVVKATAQIKASLSALRNNMQVGAERETKSLHSIPALKEDSKDGPSGDFVPDFANLEDSNIGNDVFENPSKKHTAIRGYANKNVAQSNDAILAPKKQLAKLKKGTTNLHTLFLGNLSYEIEDDDVREFVERCAGPGALVDVRVKRDILTGQGMGFAHIDFHDEDVARKVFDTLHGENLMNRPVIIDRAKE